MSTRSQQLAVYAAEGSALRGLGRRFGNVHAIQAYLDDLTSSDWWVDRWPDTPSIRVRRMRSEKWGGVARAKSAEIIISYGSANEATVLHEVAHVVCGEDGHGPVFCFTLLDLVRREMGFHAYGSLASAFRRAGCLDGRHLGG